MYLGSHKNRAVSQDGVEAAPSAVYDGGCGLEVG